MLISKKYNNSLHYNLTKQLTKISRAFYSVAIIAYGVRQFIYGNFRKVQLPPWQYDLPALNILAYVTGAGLIVGGAVIVFGKNARKVSLILGAIFLLLCCLAHVPYELISEPNKSYHLGLWENTLKELALAGGAFVVAGSCNEINWKERGVIMKSLEKIIPYGSIFFSITITSFGIAHFMYLKFIAAMVPDCIPDHTFWAYFTGTALIGAGAGIFLDIRKRKIAALLGIMIFFWFIVVHIPGAISNPLADRGNSISSAFDALAFSGISFLIAITSKTQADENIN